MLQPCRTVPDPVDARGLAGFWRQTLVIVA